MYVVAARYVTRLGAHEEVLTLLKQMATLSRAEAGNRAYLVNHSVENPQNILIYEQYVDEAAFQFHLARREFADLVKGRIWPLLESRMREIFTAVEPD